MGTDTTTTTTLYYGVTGTNGARGSNQQHAVRDTDTWKAYCGKTITEAWPTASFAGAVTCTACERAIAKAAR